MDMAMGLVTSLAPSVIWAIILAELSEIYGGSKKSFRSWRFYKWSPTDAKLMGKVAKFIKPLTVSFGHFYVITPIKLITYLHSLIFGTLKSLLTINNC